MSDQKFTRITSTGQLKTISGGSTNAGPIRVTYIQAKGHASGQLESKDFIRMATLGWPAALVALSAIIIFWWVGVLGISPSGMGF